MKSIKILSVSSCAKCKKLEADIREIVIEEKIDAKIEKVNDLQEMMKYQVLTSPGLVINNMLVHSGSFLDKKTLRALIK